MRIKSTLENYIFVTPALIIFGLFYVVPFLWIFHLSLFEWDGILPTKTFIWFQNFKEIATLDSSWWQSIRNAGYITFIALTLQNAVAFL